MIPIPPIHSGVLQLNLHQRDFIYSIIEKSSIVLDFREYKVDSNSNFAEHTSEIFEEPEAEAPVLIVLLPKMYWVSTGCIYRSRILSLEIHNSWVHCV